MLKALSEKDKNKMNKDNKLISSCIEKYKSIELANAVFIRFKPEKEFMKMVHEYKAKVDLLKDANQINSWCSNATHKKIPKIVDTITPNDVMVLINAIYFKGIWEKTFDKKKTKKSDFKNFNKNPKQVDFMNKSEKFDYFENDEVQAISLNYKQKNMKAFIILPKKEEDINVFIEKFTSEKYTEMVKGLKNVKVEFSLPKFKIEFSDELKPKFIEMGMIEAFDNKADFSLMKKDNGLYIGRIIHKTFIKVDEDGTEAAAATAVMMRCMGCAPMPETFIYMILPININSAR
jgi:serpin B